MATSRRWLAAASLLLGACGAAPTAQGPAADYAPVDAMVRDSVAKGEIPSAAYALVRGERIVHEGAANATPRTPYPLASVSKPITATALMVLAQRGDLDLDRPMAEYLRGAGRYTLRQVLSHTAGLGTYARIYWKDQAVPARPLLENLPAYGFTAQPPGTVYEYSNLGYGLLGEVIAARAGMPLGRFLEEQVFEPLGMEDAVLAEGFAVPQGAARKHGADGKALADTANDTPGAGNVYASARDLARFASFSLGHDAPGARPIVDVQARRAMQAPAETQALHPYYGGAGYGLGWYVLDSGPEPVVWHEGGMPGASSIIVLLPRRSLAAVVLVNATDANVKAQQIANALLRTAAPDYAPPGFVATDGFTRYASEPAFTGRWTGHVEIDGKRLPWTLEFQPGGAVRATFPTDRTGKPSAPQGAYAALVHGPLLVATLPGRLPARDVDQSRDGFVLLRLVARDGRLDGMAIAYSSAERLEHLYPFKAELRRE